MQKTSALKIGRILMDFQQSTLEIWKSSIRIYNIWVHLPGILVVEMQGVDVKLREGQLKT